MARAEATVIVNRPIEEVFAYLADISNNPRWQSGALEAGFSSGEPINVGAKYHMVGKFLGRRIDAAGEFTSYEPPKKYAWRQTSGPFPMAGHTALEAVEGGTQITNVLEGQPGAFFALAVPLVTRMLKRQMKTDLANLKGMLELRAEATT